MPLLSTNQFGLSMPSLQTKDSVRLLANWRPTVTISSNTDQSNTLRYLGGVMSGIAAAVGTMKAAQISKPGAGFQIVEREIPEPGAGLVRIMVNACGVCHSDALVVEGSWPGLPYPRVPGHEVAGVVDAVGAGVSEWKKGQRVGIGWHGGHDFICPECRRGDFMNCRNQQVTGFSYDGGYQEYMLAPHEALVAIPESVSDVDAAPLMCAGITTYNALRRSGALPGDLVAVQGIGGLGHLGVQFANKFGYRVAAIGRGAENCWARRPVTASDEGRGPSPALRACASLRKARRASWLRPDQAPHF